MSEYESLQQDIAGVAESLAHYANAVRRALDSHGDEIQRLWDDRAELRDELHALANRVETLTRARLTEPAEVAERMVPERHEDSYRQHEDAANVRRKYGRDV